MENVGRISPKCQALDRLATNAARPGGVRRESIQRLALGRDPSHVLHRGETEVSAGPRARTRAESNRSSHCRVTDAFQSRQFRIDNGAGEATTDLRAAWPRSCPSAAHGLAYRCPAA